MMWNLELEVAHPWDVGPPEARNLQRELACKVEAVDRVGVVQRIAGLDVAFADAGKTTCAGVVVLSFPGLVVLERRIVCRPTTFPYVPGLLSFREIPALLDALRLLDAPPDLLMCDGQGYAHPRRFGIASHLGVLTGIPSIGVGKSRLVGDYVEPGPNRGEWTALTDGDERIGAVLRTRDRTKPMFVSIGHRIDLETAVRWTLACSTGYRLPTPIRLADQWVGSEARSVSARSKT